MIGTLRLPASASSLRDWAALLLIEKEWAVECADRACASLSTGFLLESELDDREMRVHGHGSTR